MSKAGLTQLIHHTHMAQTIYLAVPKNCSTQLGYCCCTTSSFIQELQKQRSMWNVYKVSAQKLLPSRDSLTLCTTLKSCVLALHLMGTLLSRLLLSEVISCCLRLTLKRCMHQKQIWCRNSERGTFNFFLPFFAFFFWCCFLSFFK